jgi:protocatechuate 3,4-dioxygenase beta subunit
MSTKPVNGNAMDEENDDLPVGRVLNRREVLALFGFAGASLLVACAPAALNSNAASTPTLNAEAATAVTIASDPTAQATAAEVATVEVANATAVPNCVVRPEMTEGPYFVDGQLERSDIRIEPTDNSVKEGVPFTLAFAVSQIAGAACSPLAGATVDIWHCDAEGVYSGVSDPGFDTSSQSWLRGYQVTDENGRVEFMTIYPGWYSGRAVHIHFKIRTMSTTNDTYEFTSQFFFDEELTDQVHSQAPYNSKGQRNTFNETDGIYQGGGELMVLNPTATNGGYATTFDIALDLSDAEVGAADGGGAGGPGGPGGPPPNGARPPTGG